MKSLLSTLTLSFLLIPEWLYACATCYTAPEQPATAGVSMAVLFMIAVVYSVLAGVIAFLYQIRKRTKNSQNTVA